MSIAWGGRSEEDRIAEGCDPYIEMQLLRMREWERKERESQRLKVTERIVLGMCVVGSSGAVIYALAWAVWKVMQ